MREDRGKSDECSSWMWLRQRGIKRAIRKCYSQTQSNTLITACVCVYMLSVCRCVRVCTWIMTSKHSLLDFCLPPWQKQRFDFQTDVAASAFTFFFPGFDKRPSRAFSGQKSNFSHPVPVLTRLIFKKKKKGQDSQVWGLICRQWWMSLRLSF